MCSKYFAKTKTQLPKTFASNWWNDKPLYQQLKIWPRNTVKTAKRAPCSDDNNHARFFNMESDDILEVWKQSPNKHTLGFYGISSELPQTEAFLFNRLISKCLNKVNGSKEVKERRTAAAKRLPDERKSINKPQKLFREPCNRLVLNTPLLAAKVFTMPTVQKNLRADNALALMHCRKKNDQSCTFNSIQNKNMLKVSLEELVPKQKCSPRKNSNCGCERKRYIQDFEMNIKKMLEQDDPEPENYEELYVQLLQCFDHDSLDPICKAYKKCCRKSGNEIKRSGKEERAGEVRGSERKWEQRRRIHGNTERYGKEEEKAIETPVGKGEEGVDVKPHELPNSLTPSISLVPNSILKPTLPDKPVKSDDNYGSGDGPRNEKLVGKKEKDKEIHSTIRKPLENSRQKKISEKEPIQITHKEEESKESSETQKIESFLKTRDWRKHFKRPHEPPETLRQSIHSPERRESSLSPRKNSIFFQKKNKNSIIPKESIERPVLPSGKAYQPSVSSGKTGRPIVPSEKIEQPIPSEKHDQLKIKLNDDKTSIKISRRNSLDRDLKHYRNRKQLKMYIHHPRKKKNLNNPVPKPLMRNCPCKICESLKRNSDTTLIRNLKAEKKRRQLCDYYKRLHYFKFIRDEPSYRAPQHKCDPINCDNCFYCNFKWQQNCDCLNAIQELEKLLTHSTAKNDVHFNLETLKKRIFHRMCNSLS